MTTVLPGKVNFVPCPFGSLGEGCGDVFEFAVELFELDLVDWWFCWWWWWWFADDEVDRSEVSVDELFGAKLCNESGILSL